MTPDIFPNKSKLMSRFIAGAVCLFVMGIIFGFLHVLERAENNRYQSELRATILSELSIIRARLEGDLNSELLLARSLVTEVTGRPDITRERFDAIVRDFTSVSKHIRNIGLAKGTVLTYVYPEKGNEAAIGLDYRKIAVQWPAVKMAIENRKTVVAGPVTLVQGGTGIIGRTPIYLPPSRSGNTGAYFGIVSIVIDMPGLLAHAGLEATRPFRIAIRGKDGLGASGEVFYGDTEIFNDTPVLLPVTLPNGSWQLASIPVQGWNTPSPRVKYYRIAAFFISLILVGFIIAQMSAQERRKSAEFILRMNEERLRLTMEAARVYWWEENAKTGEISIDDRWYTELMRYDSPREGPHKSGELAGNTHADDRQILDEAVAEHMQKETPYYECDLRIRNKDGDWIWQLKKGKVTEKDADGNPLRAMGIVIDITERKRIEDEREDLIMELQSALNEVRTLSGLLPICANCKKIRDDKGYWKQIESYIHEHSNVQFSHGICPECARKLYPDHLFKK